MSNQNVRIVWKHRQAMVEKAAQLMFYTITILDQWWFNGETMRSWEWFNEHLPHYAAFETGDVKPTNRANLQKRFWQDAKKLATQAEDEYYALSKPERQVLAERLHAEMSDQFNHKGQKVVANGEQMSHNTITRPNSPDVTPDSTADPALPAIPMNTFLEYLLEVAIHQQVDFTIKLEFQTKPCPVCGGDGVLGTRPPERRMCEQCEGTGTIPPLDWDHEDAETGMAVRDLFSIYGSSVIFSPDVWCEVCGGAVGATCECDENDYHHHLFGKHAALFRVIPDRHSEEHAQRIQEREWCKFMEADH